MKIDRVEVTNLIYEYPEADRFQYSAGECTARLTSLVLVHTDAGQVGIGSCYSHPGLVYLIVRDQLDPLLRGEDPSDVEGLWEKMYLLTRWYGRKGAAVSAIGGVDTALWDLRGRTQGKPVWAVLGGDHSTCPAYASALLWNKMDRLAEEAASYVESGFRRMKMRLGQNEYYDREAVQTVRKAIGPDIDLMVDASMRYQLNHARRMDAFFAEQNVFWFEEPFAPEDIDSYVALHETSDIPIAAGENEFGHQGFRELLRAGALDIVQPDTSRSGGISEVLRIAGTADGHGVKVATHTWSDVIAVIANAHVVSAIKNGITVEVDQTGTPFIEDLLVEPLQIADGELELGDAPGLGIELNQTAIDRLRMSDPITVPDGSYSDMMFGKNHFPTPQSYAGKP